jgi:hypothetical protein
MGLRQCDKCSEMVDEAKAFCPACGHAFVEEEKKREASEFEKLDSTVQFGQTMYGQMLEDMGLDISSLPKPAEKRLEAIAPVNTDAAAPAKAGAVISLQPVPEKTSTRIKPQRSGKTKWYILIGIAVVFLLPAAIASAIFIFIQVFSRLK